MNDTPEMTPPVSELSETEAALKRLLGSERFRKNASLRHLLEYLVTRTLQGEQDRIKETTVAMDVFGRTEDFDSRIDNIVRVQAHRLRKLLATYYEVEGAGERVRFSIPRGGYIPHIQGVASEAPGIVRLRTEVEEDGLLTTPIDLPVVSSLAVRQHARAGWVNRNVILAFVAGVLAASSVLSTWQWLRPHRARVASLEGEHPGPLTELWGPITRGGLECVVSYSNPVFLAAGNPPGPRILIPYRGLLSAPPGAQISISPSELGLSDAVVGANPSFVFSDGWSGIGEVVAIQRLTALLGSTVPLRVLRSRALSYADIRDSNVVFLGSPWANEMQKKINMGETPLVNDNDGNILNLHPRPGEPHSFRAQVDPSNKQIMSTYGLFSVLPGVSPGTKVYISAGVNTYGTGSAMDYMTSKDGAAEICRRLSQGKGRSMPEYFQVVLRSEMIRGEPAETQPVLVREMKKPGASTVQ